MNISKRSLQIRFKERIYVIFFNKNILQENNIAINDLIESYIHLLPILYHFLGWHSKPALGLLYIASLHVPSIPGIQTAHTRHSSILQPLAALPLLDHLCLLILSANIPYVPWMVGSVMTLMGTHCKELLKISNPSNLSVNMMVTSYLLVKGGRERPNMEQQETM